MADLADLKLAASTSFTAREVDALDELLRKLRLGGDVRLIVRSPELANVARKVGVMRATVETNRQRRALLKGAAS